MSKEKILIVDDEEDILELIRKNLDYEGYSVVCAESGEKALEFVAAHYVDLIILDLLLPGIDGLTVARYLQKNERFNHLPIIMLTAKGSESDMVAGLEIGADDYIVKPFSPRILVARIRAVLRRNQQQAALRENVLNWNDLTINMDKRIVYVKRTPVNLTLTEFKVLTLLASRPGWVYSRSQIVDAVRGFNHSVADRSVDVQIAGLRGKLGPCRDHVETVRGVGYRFRA